MRKLRTDGRDKDIKRNAGQIALLFFDQNIDGANGNGWGWFDSVSNEGSSAMLAGENLFLDEDIHRPVGRGRADAQKHADICAAMVSIARPETAGSNIAFNLPGEVPKF